MECQEIEFCPPILQGSAPPQRAPRFVEGWRRAAESNHYSFPYPGFQDQLVAFDWRPPYLEEGKRFELLGPCGTTALALRRDKPDSANLPIRKVDSMMLPALGLVRFAFVLPPCDGPCDCPTQDFRCSTWQRL